jgi:predicted nucleic acid binding AN1-type Zn finger protein
MLPARQNRCLANTSTQRKQVIRDPFALARDQVSREDHLRALRAVIEIVV